jgi:DNA-binding CsgD family transcriptional regulator
MKNYDSALKYLDLCYESDRSGNRLYFVDGIYGHVYIELKAYKKAEKYLNGVLRYLEEQGNGFQASVAYYIGELKNGINETDSAFVFYNKSLKAIDSLQSQTKLKPKVLESIAILYAKKNDNKQAFHYMQRSKKWSDSLFNIQSQQNKSLFEIKNRYRDDLQKKKVQIANQTKLLELNNKAQFRLQLLIIVIILLAFIAIITFKLKTKMKKTVLEKKLNDEKNKAILDVKNKELTANALQIIEKEQLVKELLDEIKLKLPNSHKTFKNKYKQSSKKIWDDFHLRFTQINKSFYDRLLKRYPDLTPTDLKHCALVKLNFDSKEMSHLLGISVNSVHMARSRIRKKMNLKREENLNIFLNKIV